MTKCGVGRTVKHKMMFILDGCRCPRFLADPAQALLPWCAAPCAAADLQVMAAKAEPAKRAARVTVLYSNQVWLWFVRVAR